MKKRAAGPAGAAAGKSRSRLWLALQLLIWLSALAFMLALARMARRSPSTVEEAARPVSPKIAFLFLARTNLPLDFVWHAFFKNAEEDKYSICIHTEPGFVFDRTTTRSPFFYHRQLRNSIKVIWGEATMIEAERLLLSAALKDPANSRFALISDSCVPLYNFSYIYSYMMSSPKSFVDSKEGRYNVKMFPRIPTDRWRKGSQWIALVRKHAEIVVADTVAFPVFRRLCKRLTSEEHSRKNDNKDAPQKHDCIPDEHYLPTLLSLSRLDHELERRTLTYTSWNQSQDPQDNRNWHPKTFEFADASPKNIMEIKSVDNIYYKTEYRTEWCRCNGTSVPCFLFARKFSRAAAMRILNDGLVGRFDADQLSFSNS